MSARYWADKSARY